jgi:hypothetical protein
MLAPMEALASRTSCAVADLAGLTRFPMPTDLDYSRAPWDVAVVAAVGTDGLLSSPKIARSSGSRLIDVSAIKAAGNIQVVGRCLSAESGPIYLVFNPTFHDKGPDHALARAWRGDAASPARVPGKALPMDFIAGPYVAEFGDQLTSQGDYACSGEIVTALVTEIPRDNDVLSPDVIHELSSTG